MVLNLQKVEIVSREVDHSEELHSPSRSTSTMTSGDLGDISSINPSSGSKSSSGHVVSSRESSVILQHSSVTNSSGSKSSHYHSPAEAGPSIPPPARPEMMDIALSPLAPVNNDKSTPQEVSSGPVTPTGAACLTSAATIGCPQDIMATGKKSDAPEPTPSVQQSLGAKRISEESLKSLSLFSEVVLLMFGNFL